MCSSDLPALLVEDVAEVLACRRTELEDEDGDQDGDHPVGERDQAVGAHRATIAEGPDRRLAPLGRRSDVPVRRREESLRVPEERSPELDQVRRLLFPSLPPDEGWARIDAALEDAKDGERLDAIESLAETDLTADLVAALKRLQARAE